MFGAIIEHLAYQGLAPEQINNAIQLPTSAADTLTNFYMIPVSDLPLLDPLRDDPIVVIHWPICCNRTWRCW